MEEYRALEALIMKQLLLEVIEVEAEVLKLKEVSLGL